MTASGPTNASGEAPSGSPIRLSSAARMPVTWRAARVEVVGEHADGHGRRQRAGAPGDGVALVVGDRPERVAERRVLVGRGGARDRDRVVDHAVDVGVLQEQAALARALERVAERPHAVLVGVGDGADRADLDVAHRVGDADRGARAHRLRREGAERAGGGGDHLAARAAAGALERAAHRGAHAGDGQRRGERPRAGHQRAVAAPGARAARDSAAAVRGVDLARRGSPRSASRARRRRRTRRATRRSRPRCGRCPGRRGSRSASRRSPARRRCRRPPGPETRTSSRGPWPLASPSMTSRISTSKEEISVPRTTE